MIGVRVHAKPPALEHRNRRVPAPPLLVAARFKGQPRLNLPTHTCWDGYLVCMSISSLQGRIPTRLSGS